MFLSETKARKKNIQNVDEKAGWEMVLRSWAD